MQRLSRLVAENGERYYLLSKQDEGRPHDIQLVVTDGCDVWEKIMNKDDLKKLAKEASMELAPYMEETLKALTRCDSSCADFQYEVKIGGSRLQLIWKKVVSTDNIKFQLGSAVLQRQTAAKHHIMSILDFTIAEIDHWKSLSNSLESDVSQLSGEHASALKRYEKAVEDKNALEIELFTKFKMVLNSKKSKIRKLKEQIQNGTVVNSMASREQGSHSRKDDEEGGNSTDYAESDDEDGPSRTPRREQRSLTASAMPLSTVDDLLGIDSEEVHVGDPPRKRPRRGGRQARAAVSMPVPPVVKQVTRTTSSSSSGSASGRSQKQETLEAEELMEYL